MSDRQKDWFEVLARLEQGDAHAFFQVSELVTGVLRGMRAYDFEADWSDVIQDVAMGVVEAVREDRLQSGENVVGFVRQIARHKIYDRLRRRQRTHARQTSNLDDAPQGELAEKPTEPGDLLDLQRALEDLPEPQRGLVLAVYGERKTYAEASEELGVPLGSAKRYLRLGLERLRSRFEAGAPA